LRLIIIVVLCIISLAAIGCGSGGSSASVQAPAPTPTPTPTPQQALTPGNWTMQARSAVTNQTIFPDIVLVTTPTGVSGKAHITGSACFNFVTDAVSLTGTLSGPNLNITTDTPVNGQTITATLSGSATSLTGTYTLNGGTCAPGDHGTLAARLLPPVDGTWKGTFTSTAVPPALPFSVTAVLTQSNTPDPNGFLVLTGTVTFTGSTCFTSGTVTATPTLSAGQALTLNLATDNLGEIAIGGLYDDSQAPNVISPAAYHVNAGPCAGDGGNITLIRQ
jgi:hypothetical protein